MVEPTSPFWIEVADGQNHLESGTYVVDDEPVGDYVEIVRGRFTARLFTCDEDRLPKAYVELRDRRGHAFPTAEAAKAQVQLLARPAICQMLYRD